MRYDAVWIHNVATVHEAVGPLKIIRQNQVKSIAVEANAADVAGSIALA
jgi:multidrug efflux pump subunit AcrB